MLFLLWMLMEFMWNVSEYKDILIPRLGGLHFTMNFLRVIEQHMGDIGLAQVWEKSSILGPNSTEKVMDGKSYAKGARDHKLT